MNPTQSDRAGGLHFLHGRHPEHPRAALRSSKTQRIRHKSVLLLTALDAIMQRYADELGATELEALHDRVLSQLRADLRDDWTAAEAIAHALQLGRAFHTERN